jgi:hypothetical protein
MRDLFSEAASQLWLSANRVAGHALLNLLDDPAILAMAFC